MSETFNHQAIKTMGNALAAAYLDWPVWTHRRVETLALQEGRRGRRRLSIDCTILDIPWLDGSENTLRRVKKSRQVLVPLVLMRKGALKDLDVHIEEGGSLSVLSRSQNAFAAANLMFALISAEAKEPVKREVWEDLYQIASGASELMQPAAKSLIERFELSETVQDCILNFADNFLLSTLVNRELVGFRSVIKYSYHWEQHQSVGFLGPIRTALAGLGFCSTKLAVEISGADYSGTYHLEVPAPSELAISGIMFSNGVQNETKTPSDIGHLHEANSESTAASATVLLRITSQTVLPLVTLYSLLAAIVLWLLALFPQLQKSLHSNPEETTALILLVPALLFGLAARRRENHLVSKLLFPLRFTSSILALVFLMLCAFIVLRVEAALLARYLGCVAVSVSIIFAVLCCGSFITTVQTRKRLS